jgi:hypothetical protein
MLPCYHACIAHFAELLWLASHVFIGFKDHSRRCMTHSDTMSGMLGSCELVAWFPLDLLDLKLQLSTSPEMFASLTCVIGCEHHSLVHRSILDLHCSSVSQVLGSCQLVARSPFNLMDLQLQNPQHFARVRVSRACDIGCGHTCTGRSVNS